MKNLKRALSFALASVMLIGMMVVGAGAASFGDADKIEHTEAVNTMALLNVINGKDDGNFDPAGIVTRAEMAKMICIALNGGKDPVLGTAANPTYSDIKGHWAASYIEYCSNLGIVSGRGDGTFDPAATVTGSEAAKMMLVAMGWDSAVFGFTGSSWAINVGIEANTVGLYEELEGIDPSAGLSRDSAAQLIYNGIQAKTMTKEPSKVVSTGEITYNYGMNGDPILKSKFKVYVSYGQLTTVNKDKLGIVLDPDYTNKHTYPASGTAKANFSKVGADYSALLGQTVKVLYKESDNVVGVAALGCNKTVSTALSAVTVSSGKVKFDDTSYTLDNGTADTVKTIVDGADAGNQTASYFAAPLSYNEVTFVDNDADNKYEYAVVTTVTPAKVTYVSSTEIIAGGSNYKFADENIVDGLAKNDYVAIRTNLFNGNKDIVKVEPVQATVSGYKTVTNANTDYKYLLDGTWYISDNAVDSITTAGKDLKVYAVNGVIYSGEAPEAASIGNLIMLLDYDSGTINKNAKILNADGTKSIVKVDKFVQADGTTVINSPTRGNLFTYAETDDGYKFTASKTIGSDYTWTAGAASDVIDSDGATTTNKISGIGAAPNTYVIDDNAVVFAFYDNDGKVITGKQLKKLDAASNADVNPQSFGFFTSEVGGLTRATYIGVDMVSALPGVANDGSNYGVIASNAYVDSADYITYDLWTGSETVSVREKDTSVVGSRKVGAVVSYTTIDGDVIKDAQDAGATAAAVKGKIGDKVSFDGTNLLEITNKTVILYVDSTKDGADMGKADGEVVLADKVEGVYVENVLQANDGTDVTVLVVDVKNVLSVDFGAHTYTTTLTPGTLTHAAATFTDIAGAAISGEKKLKAGDIVTLTIKATGAATVKVTYTDANTKLVGDAYTSATAISLSDGQTWTRSFVVTGAADNISIVVADHA